jgi:hypothetical protein
MKSIVVFLMMVLLPVCAGAMKPISDTELSDISGQAGVSIMPNITMDIHFDVIAWGDSDGLAPGPYNPWGITASGGYVGVTNLTINNLYIGPRTDAYTGLYPITIDVANGTIRAIDESYLRFDLSALPYPFMPWNLRWR